MKIFALGERRYKVIQNWPKDSPESCTQGATDVAVDRLGFVYLLRRADPFVVVFSPEGETADTWRNPEITDPHFIRISPKDHILIADRDGHRILEFDRSGKMLKCIGDPARPGALGKPFNHPTDVAENAEGKWFVTDGYGNTCVHRFSADGTWEKTWGSPGNGDLEFTTPHSIVLLENGTLLIADRENNVLKRFDQDGNFLGKIDGAGFWHPMKIAADSEGYLYVTDQKTRLTLLNKEGQMAGCCRTFGTYAHGAAVNAAGDVFLAEMGPDGLTKMERI